MKTGEWRLLTSYFLLLTLFVFSGCGYKPSTVYTKKVLSDKIYVDSEIYLRDPENSVLVKDALNEAIVSRFGARVVSKKEATTILHVRFNSVSFMPIQYDVNGYAIYYRAKVTLTIAYRSPTAHGTETVTGFYDFPIEPKAVISDALRFQAIKQGSAKALDAFISRMAMRGVKL
ncbi:LPS assembly lipoprotein LptE [Hydrogenimonas sp. SS33]|uniref:LPS assembly lipoprotein LptE n=1 Tax=Hydrogenimonas leucolamina TaxID=2954236 RepID=UPI00336C1B11